MLFTSKHHLKKKTSYIYNVILHFEAHKFCTNSIKISWYWKFVIKGDTYFQIIYVKQTFFEGVLGEGHFFSTPYYYLIHLIYTYFNHHIFIYMFFCIQFNILYSFKFIVSINLEIKGFWYIQCNLHYNLKIWKFRMKKYKSSWILNIWYTPH